MRTGAPPADGDRPADWRAGSGDPHTGEQYFRPSVSDTAPLECQNSAYVAPQGRLKVGRGMSHELLNGDESKTFVTHKGFSHDRAHTRDLPLVPRKQMDRQQNTLRTVVRSHSSPEVFEYKMPSFKVTSGFSHHKTGFNDVPPSTATIVQTSPELDLPKPMCEDPLLGNFALTPARPTCILTTRPRLSGGTARGASPAPGFHDDDGFGDSP